MGEKVLTEILGRPPHAAEPEPPTDDDGQSDEENPILRDVADIMEFYDEIQGRLWRRLSDIHLANDAALRLTEAWVKAWRSEGCRTGE